MTKFSKMKLLWDSIPKNKVIIEVDKTLDTILGVDDSNGVQSVEISSYYEYDLTPINDPDFLYKQIRNN